MLLYGIVVDIRNANWLPVKSKIGKLVFENILDVTNIPEIAKNILATRCEMMMGEWRIISINTRGLCAIVLSSSQVQSYILGNKLLTRFPVKCETHFRVHPFKVP